MRKESLPMPVQLEVEKIAAKNPKIDIDEFRKSEEVLKRLQESGTVKRSTYGLGMPESKQHLHPTVEDEHQDCLPSFRRLR
jgi:hypothetical protein